MQISALLLSCVLLAQAEQPAPPGADLPATVRRLVRQLDDEQLAKREAAEKELAALGPAALDHLPQINNRTPAEVKDRLGRIRKQLEDDAVAAATKPSSVTLKGEMTIKEAFAALEKQTGNKVLDFREEFGQQARSIKVTVDCEQKTFWEALDQILDAAELTVYNFAGETGVVAVVARGENEIARAGRATYSGMFRFEGTRLEATRDLRNPANHLLRLGMDVAWEPRLQPIVLMQPLDDLKATDDGGAAIEIDGREGEIEVPTEPDASAVEVYLPLVLPDRHVKKIKSIQGKMTVMAPGRLETFEFTNLEKAKEVEQRRAGVTVVLEQLRKNVEVLEVRIRVKFDKASNALESHRGWIYNNPAYMIDPQGNTVPNAGLEATRQEEDEVGLAYLFTLENGAAGHKFVYKTPAAIVKLPVEYELKDIDLP